MPGDRARPEGLLGSEERYRSLVEQLPAVVYLVSGAPSHPVLYMSSAAERILGRSPEAFIADVTLWSGSIHPEDATRVLASWERAMAAREPFRERYRMVHGDGTIVWVDDDARPLPHDGTEPIAWQGLLLDVSNEVLGARALAGSEARYRALVEQLPAVVYRMGPDDERRMLFVSRYVEQVLGYSREEWLEQPDIWVEILHPDDREIQLAAHDRLTETGEPWIQEYRLIANDGRTVWVRDQAALILDEDGEPVWQGVMLDITQQKDLEARLREANDMLELRVLERTTELEDANEMMALEIGERLRIESELREARERYRHLIEDLPAVVYVWQVGGFETRLAYTSPQVERLLGFTADEWNEPTFWKGRLHPHDGDRVLRAARRSAETGEPFEEEFRYLSKDGGVVWVLSHATLLQRDGAGRPLLFQGVLLDITARKAAEAEAAEAEAQLSTLATLGPVTFYDFDLDRTPDQRVTFRFVGPAIAALIGVTEEDLHRDPLVWLRSIHPDDREVVEADAERQLRTGESSSRSYRMIDPNGRIAWVRSQTRCVARDEQGRPARFQGVIVDVTPEMEELDRLRRSERALRSFVDGIPGVPWMELVEADPGSGRMVFIGAQVEELLGYSAEELVAEPDHFERLVHPEDRQRIMALSALHDRTEEPFWAEYRAIRRDGRVIWLRSQGLASRDERGRLVWHGVTYDVTADHDEPSVERPDLAWVPERS